MSEAPKQRGISDALSSKKGCASCGQMRGLGDAIARVTDAVGIPKCGGCAKRQELLNKIVPFGTVDEQSPKSE